MSGHRVTKIIEIIEAGSALQLFPRFVRGMPEGCQSGSLVTLLAIRDGLRGSLHVFRHVGSNPEV